MARIKLGPVVTDIAGSIGGMTIQRNPFGLIARSKPIPLNKNTPAQYIVRNHILTIQNAWRSLSDAQRLQWNRFISFSGQTIRRDRKITLSGYTLYLKYQLFRLLNDQALLTTISYVPMPAFPVFEELSYSDSILYATFTDIVNPATVFFILKLTYPRSNEFRYNPRSIRFIKAPWTSTASFNITAPWLAVFGAIPPELSLLSYSIRFFSTTSPVFSGVFTGVETCLYE